MVETLEGLTIGHEELFQGLVIVTAIQRTLVIVILGIVQLSVSNSFSFPLIFVTIYKFSNCTFPFSISSLNAVPSTSSRSARLGSRSPDLTFKQHAMCGHQQTSQWRFNTLNEARLTNKSCVCRTTGSLQYSRSHPSAVSRLLHCVVGRSTRTESVWELCTPDGWKPQVQSFLFKCGTSLVRPYCCLLLNANWAVSTQLQWMYSCNSICLHHHT